ncbi:DNA polymerase IV [Balneatrix alpica]|uniref:DNA polymerase IV n=1 Tax=Balneatrix alpica TaxID=75684 RepID=A0ABV5ZBP1_9GAMM|nr:DNA polymerase IV [Balneatrix alpica]
MSDQPQRKIIHFDCDCFFAAVEMRDNPAWRDIPLAIGGDPGRRGVIATCNYPARRFGVRSAMASAHALKLCPDLLLIPGNMAKYRETSQGFRRILEDYSEQIEPLSLDEAFIDVSGSHLHQGSATLIAEEVRQRVREELGITVSAGVAPNKFLAKVASDWHKPDGIMVIRPDQVEAFVAALPVEKIWGVGKVTAEKLHRLGLFYCRDVQAWGLTRLQEQLGPRLAEHLHRYSHGRDERPLETAHTRLSLSVEHTYAVDLPDLAACQAALPALIAELEQRLARRQERPRISGHLVKLKFADFQQTTVERQLGRPDADYGALLEAAWQRGERPVRLIGVGVRLAQDQDGSATWQQLSLCWDD